MNERVMNITICSVDVPKKVEFREFFRANQHRKSTADPQLMSQNFPKFSYPYGGLLKILPKFRKVLRKFQQQIKSTANQQSNQVTRLFLGHQHCKWLYMFHFRCHICNYIKYDNSFYFILFY